MRRFSSARFTLTALLTLALVGVGATPSSGSTVTWELIEDSLNLGMSGVSPHVEKTPSGDRVWRSDGPSGTVVSMCNEAGVCTSESFTNGAGGPINDFTISQTPSGLRAYFKQVDPRTSSQAIYSAPCLDTTCLTIGAATLTTADMRVSSNVKGWGVPDPVRLPDGRIRIYNVESPTVGRCLEKVASYISSDGITFTKEPGWRLEGGYVDTEVLRANNGDWLMILADIACTSSNNQKLFVSTSPDGLTWSTPAVLTGSGPFRLDPAGYEISANVYRIYYAMGGANNTFTIHRATLRIKQGASSSPARTGRNRTTITCTKGKQSKQVTGVNPKCPKGFRKR